MATDRTLSRDRRFPTLLDRLIGQPLQSNAARREAFLADLEWLLNARSDRFALEDGSSQLEVRRDDPEYVARRKRTIASSVLNYGIPDLSGVVLSLHDEESLRRDVQLALERFEPRLVPGKLEVDIRIVDSEDVRSLGFEIRGEVQSLENVEDRFLLMVNVDMSTGRCSLVDGPNKA